MRVPPPIIFFVFMINGLVFQAVAPISVGGPPQIVARTAGLLLILLDILLIRWTFRELRKGGASSDGRPKRLVTGGPYHFSRNPMYLSAALLQFGLAIFLRNVWMAVMLLPAAVVVTMYRIYPEERDLEELFGQNYREYKSRVRRWI